VALQRARATQALIEGEKMRQELEMARIVQMSTLPSVMPAVEGYDVFGTFRPASLTGGDTFDLSLQEQGLLTVLGDATGHGIGPALSVTQMHAMLRMALRMGADLETAFLHVNNELAERLAADRFITAFIGLLDPQRHTMRFHSAGQAPILHFRAARGVCEHHDPTSFPLAAMPLARLRPATCLDFDAGDILALISDGVYEYHDAQSEQFGVARVEAMLAQHHARTAAEIAALLLDAVAHFARGAPQEDDITIVLVKREADSGVEERRFRRDFASLEAIFGFTAAFFVRHALDREMLHDVDFVLEELFTNMVKYSPGGDAEIRISMRAVDRGVEVTLTDRGVDRFDVTQAPDANTDLGIEQRRPGGLGLHLIRRLVDFLHYEYSDAERESRIRFCKSADLPDPGKDAANQGVSDAGD
jgi:serine phosphatase RsbU (regulator of sigma subunit)/anti-sigma regulatory factor (Ser/Thr protein kinase)